MKAHSNILKIALLMLGLAIFGATLWAIDIRQLWDLLLNLKYRLLPILLMYPVFFIVDVLGWKIIFPKALRSQINFYKLYVIKMAGDAINHLTPFADIGGEYLKVTHCATEFGIKKRLAFAIIFVERTALFISEVTFWFVGLIPLCLLMPLERNIKITLLFIAVIFVCFLGLLVAVQKRGLFGFIMSWVKRFKNNSESSVQWHTTSQDIDAELQKFYASKDSRWAVSLILHFISWALGGIEMFVIMHFLGIHTSLMNAMILEALLQMVRTASFFIPGNIGVQEGALALVMHSLGFDATAGVAISLIKRFRQMVFVGVGFGCIKYLSKGIKYANK